MNRMGFLWQAFPLLSPQSPSFFLGFLAPLPRLRRLRRPVSTIKPHRTIGSQTLARWMKTALQLAGVDIGMFKPHSTRHAASTAAYQASVPLEEILQRAGWSNANTFKRFYYKHVIA